MCFVIFCFTVTVVICNIDVFFIVVMKYKTLHRFLILEKRILLCMSCVKGIINMRVFLHCLFFSYVNGVLHNKSDSYKNSPIVLGYLTGGYKRSNKLFYNRPGRTISGGITLAVKVSHTTSS